MRSATSISNIYCKTRLGQPFLPGRLLSSLSFRACTKLTTEIEKASPFYLEGISSLRSTIEHDKLTERQVLERTREGQPFLPERPLLSEK